MQDRGTGPAPVLHNRPMTEHSVKKRPEGLKFFASRQDRDRNIHCPLVLHKQLSNSQISHYEITLWNCNLIFIRTCKPNHKMRCSLSENLNFSVAGRTHTYKTDISLYCGNHISICEQTTWKSLTISCLRNTLLETFESSYRRIKKTKSFSTVFRFIIV